VRPERVEPSSPRNLPPHTICPFGHSFALDNSEGIAPSDVWEAPALSGLNRSCSGKQDVAQNYRELFAAMRNVGLQFLQRFATEDRVVDDSLVTFEIARAGYWPWPIDAKIEMRLVHIFEMRDGKISHELVFDMGRPVR
jgi:hypothetical protein